MLIDGKEIQDLLDEIDNVYSVLLLPYLVCLFCYYGKESFCSCFPKTFPVSIVLRNFLKHNSEQIKMIRSFLLLISPVRYPIVSVKTSRIKLCLPRLLYGTSAWKIFQRFYFALSHLHVSLLCHFFFVFLLRDGQMS